MWECPEGRLDHQVKWNSGNPWCLGCNKPATFEPSHEWNEEGK